MLGTATVSLAAVRQASKQQASAPVIGEKGRQHGAITVVRPPTCPGLATDEHASASRAPLSPRAPLAGVSLLAGPGVEAQHAAAAARALARQGRRERRILPSGLPSGAPRLDAAWFLAGAASSAASASITPHTSLLWARVCRPRRPLPPGTPSRAAAQPSSRSSSRRPPPARPRRRRKWCTWCSSSLSRSSSRRPRQAATPRPLPTPCLVSSLCSPRTGHAAAGALCRALPGVESHPLLAAVLLEMRAVPYPGAPPPPAGMGAPYGYAAPPPVTAAPTTVVVNEAPQQRRGHPGAALAAGMVMGARMERRHIRRAVMF